MLVGLCVVFLIYLSSQLFDLYTLNWILDNFLSSVLLVIVIIFQNDIRRALVQVGSRPFFGSEQRLGGQDLEEIIRAIVTLASRRIGGLLVFERETGLNEYIEGGTNLDAQISKELILSVFTTASPIHDAPWGGKADHAAAASAPDTTQRCKTLGTRTPRAKASPRRATRVVVSPRRTADSAGGGRALTRTSMRDPAARCKAAVG